MVTQNKNSDIKPTKTLNKNENPRAGAIREFIEETGYKPKKLKHLIDYYPSLGYNTQKIHCYIAQDIEKVSEMKLEYDEFLTLVKMDFKKLHPAFVNLDPKISDAVGGS